MSLAEDVAALEQAQADGKLKGRDIEVIMRQVAEAEQKLRKLHRASALKKRVHRALLPDADAA